MCIVYHIKSANAIKKYKKLSVFHTFMEIPNMAISLCVYFNGLGKV